MKYHNLKSNCFHTLAYLIRVSLGHHGWPEQFKGMGSHLYIPFIPRHKLSFHEIHNTMFLSPCVVVLKLFLAIVTLKDS